MSSAQSAAPALGYRWGIRLFLFPARAASEHDKIVNMIPSISHDRNEETPEAKARWFQSLSLSERMELLCAFRGIAAVLYGVPRATFDVDILIEATPVD